MGIFNLFFKRKERQHEHEMEKCQHDWRMEEPTYEVGNSFKEWEGPVKDYCTKCGATRPHPECEHEWQSAEDDGNGITVNDTKTIRTAICSKCGAAKYEVPK